MPARSHLFNATVYRTALLSASVLLASASVWAETDPSGYHDIDWTGRPEGPVIARKEAGAALVEGRRDCARKKEDRAACLKNVEADYARLIKRANKEAAKR